MIFNKRSAVAGVPKSMRVCLSRAKAAHASLSATYMEIAIINGDLQWHLSERWCFYYWVYWAEYSMTGPDPFLTMRKSNIVPLG
jgi:hypothetical protein